MSQLSSYFLIPTIRAHDSLICLILPLVDDGHVSVPEDMLSLRFNLNIRTMYVEQEMYSMNGDISETILMQNNESDDGHVWNFGLGSFRAIGLSFLWGRRS